MNVNILIQKLQLLPEPLQIQVENYIEFLIQKYVDNEIAIKNILDDCFEEYEKNPTKVKTWEQIEQELIEKYQYEL
jgi:hypothetical protein